jgi:hypothetical protein
MDDECLQLDEHDQKPKTTRRFEKFGGLSHQQFCELTRMNQALTVKVKRLKTRDSRNKNEGDNTNKQ